MIKYEVIDNVPEVEVTLPRAFDTIGKHMVRSVQINFERGGRPAWPPTRSGETPLVTTGKLYRTIVYKTDPGGVTISGGQGLPYAGIHQFGGTVHPQVTEKSKKFFWAMFYETGEPMWKYMALKSVGDTLTINIPPRPYMMFQPEDVEFIRDVLKSQSFILHYPDGHTTTIQ